MNTPERVFGGRQLPSPVEFARFVSLPKSCLLRVARVHALFEQFRSA